MNSTSATLRFLVIALMLMATGIFLHYRGGHETIPARQPLATLPTQIDSWNGFDIPIAQDVLDVLGRGDFLLRTYRSLAPQPSTNLFIAYFPSQHRGETIHSPKNCLPGAGWSPVDSSRIQLALPGHPAFPANRYIIARGEDRELVLYWYQYHGRILASEYAAKFYLVADAIRYNRTDGALVRITTPIVAGETAATAQQRLESFAAPLVPLLEPRIPR